MVGIRTTQDRCACFLPVVDGLPNVRHRLVPSTSIPHERSPSTPPVVLGRPARDRLITQMLRETSFLDYEENFFNQSVGMRQLVGKTKEYLDGLLGEIGITAIGPRRAMIDCKYFCFFFGVSLGSSSFSTRHTSRVPTEQNHYQPFLFRIHREEDIGFGGLAA